MKFGHHRFQGGLDVFPSVIVGVAVAKSKLEAACDIYGLSDALLEKNRLILGLPVSSCAF